jgi:hypothetical protein
MDRQIVTAQDVAEATGQSIETVAREWREIGVDQREIEAEDASSDECHQTRSDD